MVDHMLIAASTGPSSASSISALDITELFSAAASIILAVVALALSIFFFVQSKDSADKSSRSAEEISASVSRLEKIFDSLYSDTFSIMRETVTDMRRHIWKTIPAPGALSGSDGSVESLRSISQSTILEELEKASRTVGLNDAKIAELTEQLAPRINRTSKEQRQLAEPFPQILKLVKTEPRTAAQLMIMLREPEEQFVDEVFFLGGQGLLTWDGAPGKLAMDTPLYYKGDTNSTESGQ
jgi:uncharacterized protein Yka (UPF0111/DUF47 family)